MRYRGIARLSQSGHSENPIKSKHGVPVLTLGASEQIALWCAIGVSIERWLSRLLQEFS